MSSNRYAAVPTSALTFVGLVLVMLGFLVAGRMEIVALGLGSLVVAAVLGTVVTVVGGRRS